MQVILQCNFHQDVFFGKKKKSDFHVSKCHANPLILETKAHTVWSPMVWKTECYSDEEYEECVFSGM